MEEIEKYRAEESIFELHEGQEVRVIDGNNKIEGEIISINDDTITVECIHSGAVYKCQKGTVFPIEWV